MKISLKTGLKTCFKLVLKLVSLFQSLMGGMKVEFIDLFLQISLDLCAGF